MKSPASSSSFSASWRCLIVLVLTVVTSWGPSSSSMPQLGLLGGGVAAQNYPVKPIGKGTIMATKEDDEDDDDDEDEHDEDYEDDDNDFDDDDDDDSDDDEPEL